MNKRREDNEKRSNGEEKEQGECESTKYTYNNNKHIQQRVKERRD